MLDDNLHLLAPICAFALIVIVGLYALRNTQLSNLSAIFLIAMTIRVLYFPIMASIFVPIGWRNLYGFDANLIGSVVWEYCLFMASFLICYLLIVRYSKSVKPYAFPRKQRIKNVKTASFESVFVVSLIVIGLILYLAYIDKVGISALFNRNNYAMKYEASKGAGALSLGLYFVIAAIIWAESVPKINKLILYFSRSLAAAVVAWGLLYISVRTPVAILLLGYIIVWTRKRGMTLKKVRPTIVITGLLLWGIFAIFGQIRGQLKYISDPSQLERVVLAAGSKIGGYLAEGSEWAAPFITFGEVLRDYQPAQLGPLHYVEDLATLIPVALYPGTRPEGLAQKFAQSHYPSLYFRGGGTAFSLVAESWLSLGWFMGPLVLGLFVGVGFAWIRGKQKEGPYTAAYHLLPFFTLYIVMLERNSLVQFIKAILPIIIVIYSVRGFVYLLPQKRKTKHLEKAPNIHVSYE